jgi:hypothetical protein
MPSAYEFMSLLVATLSVSKGDSGLLAGRRAMLAGVVLRAVDKPKRFD